MSRSDLRPIALTAIRKVCGLAARIVQSEIAANRWRFEPLRTPSRDSRLLVRVPQKEVFRRSKLEPFCDTEKWAHLANLG